MEARAVAKYVPMSARKVRQVVDLIRGSRVDEALAILKKLNGQKHQLISSVCISKNGVHNKVHQSDWNIDRFDGKGLSGINIDWSKAQIFGFAVYRGMQKL